MLNHLLITISSNKYNSIYQKNKWCFISDLEKHHYLKIRLSSKRRSKHQVTEVSERYEQQDNISQLSLFLKEDIHCYSNQESNWDHVITSLLLLQMFITTTLLKYAEESISLVADSRFMRWMHAKAVEVMIMIYHQKSTCRSIHRNWSLSIFRVPLNGRT